MAAREGGNADARSLGVLGAGAWGTALALQAARGGYPVTLWGRDQGAIRVLEGRRQNPRYLPGVSLPANLAIAATLADVARGHRDLLVCVPSVAFREVVTAVGPHLLPGARLAWATKGFDPASGALLHETARELLGPEVPLAVLSGPTFAAEVAAGMPSAITCAATDPQFARDLAVLLSDQHFRVYTASDLIGVQVGGAVKNVLAIGAGISDGLRFGANTRIALITRGLVEMARLGVALGANAVTFTGLSGMGDLILTATDNQSRNRRLGLAVGGGLKAAEALARLGEVVEGYRAARSVQLAAKRLGVELPICEQVFRILYEAAEPQAAVLALMTRSLKAESDPYVWPDQGPA